ncbi:uncharacterized protein wu:fa19b12 [Gadus chalcogrammus]|uniref:uncharacterized protein wu:fa19b12 n=1 Tax=Gadus chalcogrammus TaxID=1042646 RepID=UPI0024C4DAAD|nr:uncharacterized protein wu:fa19b12 [Gadus chalcogrammus]
MTKRRAEDALFGGVPTKTCYGSLCSLDMQLKGSATSGPVDPPSLQALLGSRCRKRPYSPEEADVQESVLNRKPATDDPGNHALNSAMADSSSSSRDRSTSPTRNIAKKRARDDADVPQKTVQKVAKANNDKNDDSEDISFNYFQFWRTPLPALDLSLLEDEDSKSESRKNVTAKDGMET